MNKDEIIDDLKHERNVLIGAIVLILIFFTGISFIQNYILQNQIDELICDVKGVNAVPVYNKSSNQGVQTPMGYKCCTETENFIFNDKTGDWSTKINEYCKYVPKK